MYGFDKLVEFYFLDRFCCWFSNKTKKKEKEIGLMMSKMSKMTRKIELKLEQTYKNNNNCIRVFFFLLFKYRYILIKVLG